MGVEESGETTRVNQETRPEMTGAEVDDSSPRGVLDVTGAGSDSDNSNNSCSSSDSPKKANQRAVSKDPQGLQWKNMIDTFKKKSVRRFSVIPLLTSYEVSRKNLRRRLGKFQGSEEEIDIDSDILPMPKPSWENFYYSELAAATNNFSHENLLGKGGNAEVYKGHLQDGRIVAVKKLMKNEKDAEDKASDFLLELGIIAHINHPNTAHLVGFSIDGGLHLVLKFSPHGSLASVLFGSEQTLDWKTRYKVASGVADGLQYLHHDCHKRIIHRDIKASNILLTEDNEAQISDFGLAKWLPEKWTHHIIHPIEGTFGYLAPEYFMHGIANEKTDVFAFGVLLLELLTGRRAVDSSRQSLVMWAKPLLESESLKDLVDPRLGDDYDLTEVSRVMSAASACIHHLPESRPNMTRVVLLLKGEAETLELNPKSPMNRVMVFDGLDLQDYTCPSYLSDLDRHRQLIME